MASARERREYKYEVEEIAQGERVEDKTKDCHKKQFHEQHIQEKDFTKECLPTARRDDQVLVKFINILFMLSVKIKVLHAKGTSYGTGFITRAEREGDTVILVVATVFHVVEQANKSKPSGCRLLFDEAFKTKVGQHLYNVRCKKIQLEDEKEDWCELYFDLPKQADFLQSYIDKFWELGHELKEKYEDKNLTDVFIVGYPHSGEKVISIGNLHQTSGKKITAEVRENQDKCVFRYNCPTCPGMSGAFIYHLGSWFDGYGYWFHHFHHHSEGGENDNEENLSSVGTESTLMYHVTA